MAKDPTPKPNDADEDDLAVVVTSDGVEHVGILPLSAAGTDEPQREPLPSHKDDLVALAIDRGIPSYEAWAMTIPELTEKLES